MSSVQSNNSFKDKIGIDLTSLDANYFGGIDVYCNGIIEGAKKNKKNKFIIFINENYKKKRKLKNTENIKFFFFELNILKKLALKIYNRTFPFISFFLFSFKYKLDFYIRNFVYSEFKNIVEKKVQYLVCPDTFLKNYNFKIQVSVNIHDLNHIEFPDDFSFQEKLKREYLYYNTIRYSDSLVLSSYGIKKNVLKNYNSKIKNLDNKISVVSEGISSEINFKKVKIPFKNFFLFPAQLWKHKNHEMVIEAFQKFNTLHKNIYKLIFTGVKNNKKTLKIIQNANNCYHLGLVNRNFLYNLYYQSIGTICSSKAEESSLPMLEAFRSKSIVIASDNLSNIEKSKKFKFIIFKKDKIDSFYNSLVLIVKKRKIYNKFKTHNFKLLKIFSWEILLKKWISKLI